jgi:hypothetical protein
MTCNVTPGTNFTAKKIAKIETKICQNKFLILFQIYFVEISLTFLKSLMFLVNKIVLVK